MVKKRGVPSQKQLYSMLARDARETVGGLLALTKHPNPSVRLGAIKLVVNKLIPDLKSEAVTVEEKNPITIKVVADYPSTASPIQ